MGDYARCGESLVWLQRRGRSGTGALRSRSPIAQRRSGDAPAVVAGAGPVLKDVVGLRQVGAGKVKCQLAGADRSLSPLAREDEMRDVLLNVFENARLAGARHSEVTLREEDRRVLIETR